MQLSIFFEIKKIRPLINNVYETHCSIWKYDIGKFLTFCSDFLASPPEPMALRLSSNLMIGITRVYNQQWHLYYSKALFISSMRRKNNSESANLFFLFC